jgi:lipopolysaccharide biosynthesis glycosyltransferase
MKEPKIKILVGYHKPATLLKSDIFTPIHLGRAVTLDESKDGALDADDLKWMQENMIGDDTGDHISNLNRTVNELTAFYWAWKNPDKLDNPDYIGFMHYRRHLSFADEKLPEKEKQTFDQMYETFALDDEYLQKTRLNNDEKITNKCADYDVVIKSRHRLPGTPYQHYEHNREGHTKIKDYDTVLRILAEKYPSFIKYSEKYNSGKFAYFTNIIIMKSELFYQYCEWLFDIIFETQKQIDISNYSAQEARACAYISEWLMGIYITYLYNATDKKILELQGTYIENSDYGVIPAIKPAFARNNVPVVFACEGDFYLYTGVAISSLIKNASSNYNYDILIFADPEALKKKNLLLSLAENYDNINIRLINALSFIDNHTNNLLFVSHHLRKSAYYRLLASAILSNYDKTLYLDSDIVIHKDAAQLFNTDLENNIIAAVLDVGVHIGFHTNVWHQQYLLFRLKLENPYNYFNSGILVMNLKKIRYERIERRFFDKLAELKNPNFWDQDVLNCVCEGNVKFLDIKWNHQFSPPYQTPNCANDCPTKLIKEYIVNIDDHYITHFTDWFKPWLEPRKTLAEHFWRYARNTSFYDEIIQKNIGKISQNTINDIYWLMREIYYSNKLAYDKRRYKILYLLSFGRVKKYKEKYNKAKRRLKELKRRLSW